MAAPTLTPTPVLDDDGSRTTGSIWNAAWQLLLEGNIQAAFNALFTTLDAGSTGLTAAAPKTSTVTTTGNITALALPSGTGDLVIYLNNATLATIQGIAAGLAGQRLTLISMGAGQVDLSHQDAAASAALRLINFATSGKTSLAAGSGVGVYVYDGTAPRWRLVSHDQGGWITPPFAAGDYTAATGTWTVQAGDVAMCRYRLSGRTLSMKFSFLTTDVSATPSSLNRVIPGGFTAGGSLFTFCRVVNAGAGVAVGMVFPSGTSLQFFSDINGSGWAIAVANTRIDLDVSVDVT